VTRLTATQPVFFYDLGNPDCYLVAERIMAELEVAPEWEPVLGRELGATPEHLDRGRIEMLANQFGLQPLRWPSRWPPETTTAMLAATYAKRIGRTVAFSLAAFRQAFAGGRDLGEEGTVLIAAAACEMHPNAVLTGINLRSVATALRVASVRARDAGARSLPAIRTGDELFEGPDCLELVHDLIGAPR
jgi:2-hydroxychromene-2-carboxylate isomerase